MRKSTYAAIVALVGLIAAGCSEQDRPRAALGACTHVDRPPSIEALEYGFSELIWFDEPSDLDRYRLEDALNDLKGWGDPSYRPRRRRPKTTRIVRAQVLDWSAYLGLDDIIDERIIVLAEKQEGTENPANDHGHWCLVELRYRYNEETAGEQKNWRLISRSHGRFPSCFEPWNVQTRIREARQEAGWDKPGSGWNWVERCAEGFE